MSVIYLDNAATTKMDESLLEVYRTYSCDKFYNASAGYVWGVENYKDLEKARKVILEKLGAKKGDIVFTGCATESNNIAIKGCLREGKWEYVFSKGEHPSVFNVAKRLEESGKTVKYVDLKKDGQIDYEKLSGLINEKTRLVSVMFVNNETGAINDLHRISKIVKEKNPKALLHVDAVQGFCKIPFSLSELNIDFLTISAHKFHGPKGVGALYVKNKDGFKSIMLGGGQEFGLRGGTENLAGIMAMAKICEKINVRENYGKVAILKEKMIETLNDPNIRYIKTDSPYICSFSFKGVNGETLMRALENEVVVGTGSACSSKKAGNRVLQEMGFDNDYIKSSIRISFNYNQSVKEIETAGSLILKKYYEILEKVKWRLCCWGLESFSLKEETEKFLKIA